MTPPFPFIVGCGRSGTTLLRAMCDAHPQLAIPPESHFIVPVARARRSATTAAPDTGEFLDELCASSRFALWELDRSVLAAALAKSPPATYSDAVRQVFALYAAARGKERYGDKTPVYVLHLAELARLFPEAVFVHLVRDGRDVACSFLDLGWAETVEQAALHWRLRVRRGRRAGGRLPSTRYHEVRYEDLVRAPELTVHRLCAVLQLPYAPAMLEHVDHAAEVMQTTSHPAYHRRLAQPPTPGLRDWRRELTEDQIAAFELLAGDTLDELGYPLQTDRPPAAVRIAARRRWARWQLHRVARRARLGRPQPRPTT